MEFFLPFDIPILDFLQRTFHNPLTDTLLPLATYICEFGACWIFLGLSLLFIKKYRRAGVLILLSLAAATLLGEGLLKNILCRPRPFQYFGLDPGALLVAPPSGYSFPSGHTCASFAAATALFCQHKKQGLLAYILAAVIGFSRMFLWVHFPSDVLAGAVLGVLVGVGVTLACEKWLLPKLKARWDL